MRGVGNLRFEWWGNHLIARITDDRGGALQAVVTDLHLAVLEQSFRERNLTPDPEPTPQPECSRWEMLEFAECDHA